LKGLSLQTHHDDSEDTAQLVWGLMPSC
jgi:hypothetical protein